MTREPDRYELAPAALERIAKAFEANPTAQHSGAAVASILRYLAMGSPAAAPAAETCPEPPPGLVETLEKVHGMGCGNIATHRIPAAPEKEIANLLGRGHVRNPREGEPGDAETYSSPPPLLPRVLAALEQEASNHDEYDSRYEYERAALLRALADELRAYIAERAAKAKGEGR